MDAGEGINVSLIVDSKPEDKNEDDKKVNVRIGVFFDGTLNSRTNTERRIAASNKNLSPSEKMAYEKLYNPYKGETSYENDDTNVTKIERYINVVKEFPDYNLSAYIEGPGTEDFNEDNEYKDKDDYGHDNKWGYGLGTGRTGLREKVKKGITEVVNNIKENVDKSYIIEQLTIDVFGFSRGAAGARNFIYEALFGDELEPIKQKLSQDGYTIYEVNVDFVGLYDTVSSHGLVYFNDVSDLKLNSVRHAKKVIHLVSADEHRENFSLTNINSASYKGREIFLPGVHSDIGGSYNHGKPEAKLIYDSWLSMVDEDKEKLIRAGWFNKNEISVSIYSENTETGDTYAASKINRASISSHYSRIPLHIMSKFTRENNIKIKSKLESVENINDTNLVKMKSRIDQYISETDPKNNKDNGQAKSSKIDDWHNNDDPLLNILRNKYFHFSAEWKFGLKPRMSFWKNRRYRKIYNG